MDTLPRMFGCFLNACTLPVSTPPLGKGFLATV